MTRKDGWRVRAACLLLEMSTLALYSPAFTFSFFCYDDPFYVANNPHLKPITLNDLAWLLATDPHAEIRRGAEAVQLADRACALTRDQEPVFLGTLAAAYAETGDFDKAVLVGQKAHDLALAQGLKASAETNLQLVALYRAHKPFRENK
jgi:hypothetical protein